MTLFLAILGGTENGTCGAQILILRPHSNTNTPLKPHLDTLGAILDPGKAIFAKTKTVLESVNKMGQLVGMSKGRFGNSLK